MRDTNATQEPTTDAVKLEAHKAALSAKIERLGAKPGDVVIVKPAGEAHRPWSNEATEALSEHLGRHLGDTGLLLISPPGTDIESLDEALMAKHGWVRVENCSEFRRDE